MKENEISACFWWGGWFLTATFAGLKWDWQIGMMIISMAVAIFPVVRWL